MHYTVVASTLIALYSESFVNYTTLRGTVRELRDIEFLKIIIHVNMEGFAEPVTNIKIDIFEEYSYVATNIIKSCDVNECTIHA